jgi:hypothetical protein
MGGIIPRPSKGTFGQIKDSHVLLQELLAAQQETNRLLGELLKTRTAA